MKNLFKMSLTVLVIFCSLHVKAQDSEYKYWFTRNGVEVYEKWSCAGCSDLHLKLKIVNRNSYKVTIAWDKFQWMSNGVVIAHETGQMDDFAPGREKSGDYQGLFFYPPKNYNPGLLRFQLDNFSVQKTN